MPFTPCLDVTLRVAAVPATPRAALRLQAELTELARDPQRWPFRSFRADVEDEALIVRALLPEPVEDLYEPVPDGNGAGEPTAIDVLVALLHTHCSTWHALDVGERRLSAHVQRVHRRYWTNGGMKF